MEEVVIREFDRFEGFEQFARERAAALAMKLRRCRLDELAPYWVVDGESVRRPDGAFFTVDGVEIIEAAGRAISGWFQPMMFQPSGYVAMINSHVPSADRNDWMLVRLFAEPGNKGIEVGGTNTRVLVGPPVQFSPGNLENHQKALRGETDEEGRPYKPVPFASVALPKTPDWASSVTWEGAAEDGGRFFEKVNRYGLVHVRELGDVQNEIDLSGQPENFAWIRMSVWCEARRLGIINGHLRSISSLLV